MYFQSITVSVVPSMSAIPAADWDLCAVEAAGGEEKRNPFISHAFLQCLEDSRSAVRVRGMRGKWEQVLKAERVSLLFRFLPLLPASPHSLPSVLLSPPPPSFFPLNLPPARSPSPPLPHSHSRFSLARCLVC